MVLPWIPKPGARFSPTFSGEPRTGIQLRGLRFSASGPTYMMPHGVPSAGDWALDRYSAVFMQGTQHTLIDNCRLGKAQGEGSKEFFFGMDFGGILKSILFKGFLGSFDWILLEF